MPLVSVLMPCHNAGRWLEKALVSILRQTHDDLEILTFDDGSSDDTREILNRMGDLDHRIKVYGSDTNGGIVLALNTLIAHAQGAFIARMDADDVSRSSRIALQLDYMRENALDLCGSWTIEIGQGLPRTVRWPVEPESVCAALLFQNPICHPTIVARRDIFERYQYRKSHELSEDYDLFSRISGSYRLANLPMPLLRYRRHPGQATQAKRGRMEEVAKLIRLDALEQQGFNPSDEEIRLHNLVRGPCSIRDVDDLKGIEEWLLKLHASYDSVPAQKIIASQWIRACIRAAPIKGEMWRCFRSSRLRDYAGAQSKVDADLYLLSIAGLDYAGSTFHFMRRFGLSA